MSGYYAVIPVPVLDDRTLNAQQKILYAEISALCNREGYCWARNAFFAEKNGVTARAVKNWIAALQDRGYIRCETSGPKRKIYLCDLRRGDTEAFHTALKHAEQEKEHAEQEEIDQQEGKNFPPSLPSRNVQNVGGGRDFPSLGEKNCPHNITVSNKESEYNTIPKTETELSPCGGLADAKEVGKYVLKSMTAVCPITRQEYPFHAKKARQIAERVCEMAPESPSAAAGVVLAAFRDLTEHGDGFWRKQPYTAATLASAGIWSRVVAYIRDTYKTYRGREEPVGDWENFMEDVW